jgi:hypothetical protein
MNDKLLITSEVSALLFHPAFNPKKLKTAGIISVEGEETEITTESQISINKTFQANSLKINTVPTIYKVCIILFIYCLETSR